ncbi:MAG TPA: PilN domain-containing protein [Bacteriovoracaceae bacterium]|nr:PilN domain-containing protein [Bacteriovoracaceae bacterium]
MIKINLSTAKKQVSMTNVGGFDFTKLKIKALFLVMLALYIPDLLVIPMWETEIQELNANLQAKQAELTKLKSKVSQTASLEKQIRELKSQEENLGQKLLAVKQAISEKKNPAPLLLYIAKNVPNELWIKELNLDNETMIIKGEALDYTSIGNFVNNLRSSVFIKDASITNTSSSVREADKRRIESFEVKFLIGKFEQ